MFFRHYDPLLASLIKPRKVLVIYGPRRVGKTFLLDRFLKRQKGKYFSGVGEDRLLREILESASLERIKSSFAGYDLVVIDEAQKIRDVGEGLKLVVDHLPDTAVIATGSSSFDLAGKVGEPLTGRKRTLVLYPLSVLETKSQFGPMWPQEKLEELLVYGSYPETLSFENEKDKSDYLHELRDSYLCRDILELDNVRNARKILDLLTMLAFQIGREVSLNELATALGMSQQTVARYLDLLEKAFVIRNVRAYSRNHRKEVTKMSRYYFLDNGVRNAVVNNFNRLNRRNDTGQLFENFLFMDRLKKQHYTGDRTNNYFWRTYDRQEIDHVEERGGEVVGYEFKFSSTKKTKSPGAWSRTYPEADYKVITRENFLPFVS